MRMQSKRTTEESTDRGVSPVIGVILMVAITVILAAVIAAFVLDIGPGDTDPSATYDKDIVDDDEVDVTLNSLGSGTDGIVVVEDATQDDGDFAGEPLTVSGESGTFSLDPDDFGSGAAIVAYSADEDPGESDLSEVDNFAIIDNLDEYDD